MFQTKFTEVIRTHILCSMTFFSENRLWDNAEKYGTAGQATDGKATRHKRFAYWITKATNTLSEYVMLIAFSRKICSRERASMLSYTYTDCLVSAYIWLGYL